VSTEAYAWWATIEHKLVAEGSNAAARGDSARLQKVRDALEALDEIRYACYGRGGR